MATEKYYYDRTHWLLELFNLKYGEYPEPWSAVYEGFARDRADVSLTDIVGEVSQLRYG